jgi:hypothetical protein
MVGNWCEAPATVAVVASPNFANSRIQANPLFPSGRGQTGSGSSVAILSSLPVRRQTGRWLAPKRNFLSFIFRPAPGLSGIFYLLNPLATSLNIR